jgi:hypothetical protein
MMRLRSFALAGALLATAALPACAADDRDSAGNPNDGYGVWGFDAEASSASLARDGWKFLALSTMSWPDGRQAVVTMWVSQLGDFARCFDYFDAKMMQVGGKCERSGTGL